MNYRGGDLPHLAKGTESLQTRCLEEGGFEPLVPLTLDSKPEALAEPALELSLGRLLEPKLDRVKERPI
jgi:hypothetical protein